MASNDDAIRAIKLLVGKIAALVLLIHVPTRGTPMQGSSPLQEETFLQVLDHALAKLSCPVILGCMRPRGRVRLEVEAVKRGVEGIASPAAGTVEELRKMGYELERREVCCALHR